MLTRKMIVGIALVVCAVIIPVQATTYYVDPDGNDNDNNGLSWATAFKTIQKGINSSVNGDIVEVNEGTYTETLDFSPYGQGLSCTVTSTDPNDWNAVAATVINGNGATNVVTFDLGSSGTLCGFTVTGGTSGIYFTQGNPIVSNCIIRNNTDKGMMANYVNLIIRNCFIQDNGGEGIYADSATITVKNSIIYGNNEGIKSNQYVTVIAQNNTIIDNTSYGINCGVTGTATISNCILWGNSDDLSDCNATYSCIEDGDAGTGNISSDPCFIDADGNDFHLDSNSLCVDAGDPNGDYEGQVDIDGQLRVIYGRVDIGADEWGKQIPVLNWQERSDWINVKTDVTPAAVGDGVADDTNALQKALDEVGRWVGDKKTVYLPPGTYRITRTLTFSTRELPDPFYNGICSGLILGHGRATRIVWDGNDGGCMLRTTNAIWTYYIGQIWDGKGKAAVGISHLSEKGYQTLMRHQNQAFLNFTDSGIKTDTPADGNATSEVLFKNCLFENCHNGVSILSFNCYDNWFEGCEFRNCGKGIYCYIGNIGVRNCHFENSSDTDIFTRVSIHGKQIRRCTSIGSRRFLTDNQGYHTIHYNPQIVEDCQISGWRDLNGAIVLGFRGPTTIFDCNFTDPPDYNKPPIRLVNPDTMLQLLVLSNCHSDTNDLYYANPNGARVTVIPDGNRTSNLNSPTQSFLDSEWRIPGKVFDAKKDFNAVGNGIADDSNAIQATINAARDEGNDAIAYLPSGLYKVTKTIDVTGADYFIGGVMPWGTHIVYHGPSGGVIFDVNDPCNVVMERLGIDASDPYDLNTMFVRQTGTSNTSSILYDGIYGRYGNPDPCGIDITPPPCWEFKNLPHGAKVHIHQTVGSIDVKNCSRATIFIEGLVAGNNYVAVEGTDTQRDGFLGIASAAMGAIYDASLRVKDNQSIVCTNWYQENADRYIKLEGDANLPAGHVSIAPIRSSTCEQDFINIDDYKGNFFLGGSDIGMQNADGYPLEEPVHIHQTGSNTVKMMFVGNSFLFKNPNFIYDANGATLILVENIVSDENDAKHCVSNIIPEGGLEETREAFDDFLKLGEVDLSFNHPIDFAIGQKSVTTSATAGGTVITPGIGIYWYDHGINANIVATADLNYHFVNWTGSAVDAGKVADPNSATTTVLMDGDYTVVANFAIDTHTVTFVAGANGSITGTLVQVVNHGSDCTVVTAVANANYHFDGWTGDYVGMDNPLTITNVTADMTITANFAIDTHTVTFIEGANGGITGTLVQVVNHGSDCTAVTAVANANYHFDGWTGDYIGMTNPLTITNVTADMTITANFAIDTHTVTFIEGANGGITGTLVQVVNHGSDCTAVQAVPNANYHFTGWTGSYVGMTNPLTITNVTADMTITANFAIDTHTVTFVAGANGSITGTLVQVVNHGSDCTAVTAVANANYHFTGWTGDYIGMTNPLTITNVTADMTITANFALNPPGQATNPNPANLATDVNIYADLSWTAGNGATSHLVYFGANSTPGAGEYKGEQTGTTYDPGTLNYSTNYYWRIDEKNPGGTTTGVVWSFTTTSAPVILLQDGFETNFNKWTDGGTTDWDRATSQKYSGSYSAHAGSSDNDLISDNLNTTGKSSIRIEFWYRDDDIDDGDNIYLQLYNGSTYANKFELGNSAEDTWHKCDITVNNSGGDAQYFRSNFRIKFEGTSIDSGENLWIDDVNVTAQ